METIEFVVKSDEMGIIYNKIFLFKDEAKKYCDLKRSRGYEASVKKITRISELIY